MCTFPLPVPRQMSRMSRIPLPLGHSIRMLVNDTPSRVHQSARSRFQITGQQARHTHPKVRMELLAIALPLGILIINLLKVFAIHRLFQALGHKGSPSPDVSKQKKDRRLQRGLWYQLPRGPAQLEVSVQKEL